MKSNVVQNFLLKNITKGLFNRCIKYTFNTLFKIIGNNNSHKTIKYTTITLILKFINLESLIITVIVGYLNGLIFF